MKRLLVVALVALVAVPAAQAWRKPTAAERAAVLKALPHFYHQPCVRFQVRISSADARFAAVWFSFVNPMQKGCSPFDGQTLMKRATRTAKTWRKIAEGSSWPCNLRLATPRVLRDLFGACHP